MTQEQVEEFSFDKTTGKDGIDGASGENPSGADDFPFDELDR